MNRLNKGLNQFFHQYRSTQELVNGWVQAKTHPQEILILLCSRIDALASGATSEDAPSARAFTSFVTTYSGKSNLFDSVSVGDVFYELDYHLWLLPGMLEKAGRIRIFSQLNEPILRLLVDSEIALTLEAAQRLLKRIQTILRKHFHVAPNQSKKKKRLASTIKIKQVVADGFKGNRSGVSESALSKAIDSLISSKTLARILYQRFRCEAIHGGRVAIDEPRFFSETEPYWKPMYSDSYGPFQFVEFPAQFLTSLYSDCIRNYRKRLENTGKVPPNIHFEMFPDSAFGHLKLLDTTLLPKGRVAFPK